MPILDVEIVSPGALPTSSGMAAALADATSRALGSPRGHTWVKLHIISAADYAEDGEGPQGGVSPVFVRWIMGDLPPVPELKVQIERLTRAVAEVCDRPAEMIHVICEPPARGRIAFGGRLLT